MSEALYFLDDVRFEEEPNCEHCGSLEPFSPVVGEVDYCLGCATYGGELILNSFEEEALRIIENKLKINYHRGALASLESELMIQVLNADDGVLDTVVEIEEDKGYN